MRASDVYIIIGGEHLIDEVRTKSDVVLQSPKWHIVQARSGYYYQTGLAFVLVMECRIMG